MTKYVSIDTNLLVLFVVGATSKAYIKKHKRCGSFDVDDFNLLTGLLEFPRDLILTPNTLTETSNLIRQIGDPICTEICLFFRAFIQGGRECFVTSSKASARDEFIRLGLTDAALLEVASDDVVLVTTDLDLHVAASKAGYATLNFNHLRETRI